MLEFLQTTYEAAATLGGWDRDALEIDYASKRAGKDRVTGAPMAMSRIA